MKILAIETSCDETGVAIVEATKNADAFEFRVLGNALLSQAPLHAQYGGVYPNLAKREHEKNLPIILEQALADAGMSAPPPVDAIAVTYGPGLEPTLWSGITFAQKLAAQWNMPLIPTNHMEGHLISSLSQHGTLADVSLPVLGLLVSGGHTEFVLMEQWFTYRIIGQTQDDAVGEAFDKVARMLGLSYPGGPQISKLAEQARKGSLTNFSVKLPRPMLHSGTCDVSFSGLKTAVLYALRDRGGIQNLSSDEIAAVAEEFEDAVADVLVEKTRQALMETGVQTFVIGGGVAANKHLRETLKNFIAKEFPDVAFLLPDAGITGDNAVMIAMAALSRSLAGVEVIPAPESIRAIGNLSLQAGS